MDKGKKDFLWWLCLAIVILGFGALILVFLAWVFYILAMVSQWLAFGVYIFVLALSYVLARSGTYPK